MDKSEAFKREWYLKHPAGYLEKLKIIKNFGGVAQRPSASAWKADMP